MARSVGRDMPARSATSRAESPRLFRASRTFSPNSTSRRATRGKAWLEVRAMKLFLPLTAELAIIISLFGLDRAGLARLSQPTRVEKRTIFDGAAPLRAISPRIRTGQVRSNQPRRFLEPVLGRQ